MEALFRTARMNASSGNVVTNSDSSASRVTIWRCPRCRGELVDLKEALACRPCGAEYPCFDGIPDLRLPGASWIDHKKDREEARRLLAETIGFNAEKMARHVFGWNKEMGDAWAEMRTRQLVEGRARMAREIKGWLKDCLPSDGRVFLDVGCGNGLFLASAASLNCNGIGIDVRLVWLLVAKRLIEAAGGTPRLAAAMAETLPLADGSVHGLVSLDVIEHVGDVGTYLREIDRVAAPGAQVAFATPNRYSLTAEPHVFVWGVGFVPRRWQKAYVKFRSGRAYEFVRLLSVSETRRLFRQHTQIAIKILIPQVAAEEIAHFPAHRKAAARFYNVVAGWWIFAPLFFLVGPFFRMVGRKSHPTQ